MPFRIPSGWQQRLSPNQSPRSAQVTALVLHADAASRHDASLDWIRRSESKVSYHVLISRTGEVFCLVHPDRTAWHAGQSELAGERFVNRFSVGVCLANRNDGNERYPGVQLSTAADVCAVLCGFYGIPVERIVTHAAIATPAGRKTDPKGLDLDTFREMVAARIAHASPPPVPAP